MLGFLWIWKNVVGLDEPGHDGTLG